MAQGVPPVGPAQSVTQFNRQCCASTVLILAGLGLFLAGGVLYSRRPTWLPKVMMGAGGTLALPALYCCRKRPQAAVEPLVDTSDEAMLAAARSYVDPSPYPPLAERRWRDVPAAQRCYEDLRMVARSRGGADNGDIVSWHYPRLAQLYMQQMGSPEAALIRLLSDTGSSEEIRVTGHRVVGHFYTLMDNCRDIGVREEMRIFKAVLANTSWRRYEDNFVHENAEAWVIAKWLRATADIDSEIAPQYMEWMLYREPQWISQFRGIRDLKALFHCFDPSIRRMQIAEALLNASPPGELRQELVRKTLGELDWFAQTNPGMPIGSHSLLDALAARGADPNAVARVRARLPAQAPAAPPLPAVLAPAMPTQPNGSHESS
jgi:hypothetical protein